MEGVNTGATPSLWMLWTLVNGDGLCVHDEILLEVPIEATDEVALILKDTMEEAGRAFLKIVLVETEVVVVDSWAEK